MRQAVLGGGVEFGGGTVEIPHIEQRVIAEAALAARLGQDLAMPFALGDQRLRIVGMADENDDRDEVGGAVAMRAKFGEQLLVVAGIRFRLAGVARGMDAGSAAEVQKVRN